jgi:hypothetical protein
MTTFRRVLTRAVAGAAAALMLAACSVESLLESALGRVEGVGDVTIDFSEEGGTFSITSEEGEVFGLDVDSQGQMEITTSDGTVSTTMDGEIPPEVSAAIDIPAGFTAQAVTRLTDTEDGNAILVQGAIAGDFTAILDELEASIDRRWAQTQRMIMTEGQMGAIVGTDEAEEYGLHATLIMEQDGAEGMLQLMLLQP